MDRHGRRTLKRALATILFPLAIVGCSSNQSEIRPYSNISDEARAAIASGDPIQTQVNADAHFAAGQLAESQGRLVDAVEQYQAALRISPDHQNSIYAIARLLTLQKRFDLAIPAWERYVKATGENPTAWNNLARCHEMVENFTAAEACYLRAISRNPNHEQTRINYGLMLAQRDRIDEATEQLGAVLKPAAVAYNLASVYELRGNTAEAKKLYQLAISIEPNFREAKVRLAKLQ